MKIKQLVLVSVLSFGSLMVQCVAQSSNPLGSSGIPTVGSVDAETLAFMGQAAGDSWSGPIRLSEFHLKTMAWGEARPVIETSGVIRSLKMVSPQSPGKIGLLSVETAPDQGFALSIRTSTDRGKTWSDPQPLATRETPFEIAWTIPHGEIKIFIGLKDESGEFEVLDYEFPSIEGEATKKGGAMSVPIFVGQSGGAIDLYFTSQKNSRRYQRLHLSSEGPAHLEWINLPSAVRNDSPQQTADIQRLADGRLLAIGNDNVLRTQELSVRFSYDGGKTWPVRRILDDSAPSAGARLSIDPEGKYHLFYLKEGALQHTIVGDDWALEQTRLHTRPRLANVVPPLDWEDMVDPAHDTPLPVRDVPYQVHVRVEPDPSDWEKADRPEVPASVEGVESKIVTPIVKQGTREWVGTEDGLYSRAADSGPFARYSSHGVSGPLATHIAGLAVDSKNNLWVATPAGLSRRTPGGEWTSIRGREGLPWEELICIAIDSQDRLWLGGTRGLIQYRPDSEDRQWFYRAGERYLPGDVVSEIAIANDGKTVLALTDQGLGRIDEVTRTLYEKAEIFEEGFNARHRRLGLASLSRYKDDTLQEWTLSDQPSDGLWTSYHITAMSLAYSLTGEERYLESARTGMEALYLLQNVTGVPGLVARTIAEVGSPAAEGKLEQDNWHEAPDSKYIWRDDVSSDQLDGHFFAFHTYFEHIAQFDPAERERIEKQIRQVFDYILDNNYQIIDWDGERTLWGWWNPEMVNDDPNRYLESGLYSLMMLSFLQVAHYITDDVKYLDHYRSLIEEHDYLGNQFLQKKVFPDELNHSDDQLSAITFYPIIQLEHNPFIRDAIHASARRHAAIEALERNSLFNFVYASIDSKYADVEGGVRTLREYPVDRRFYGMNNSHRADVVFSPHLDVGGREVLLNVLPYDEHHFERWNQDPYRPDFGGDGLTEGSGEQFLLPYWMARYHGLLSPPVE